MADNVAIELDVSRAQASLDALGAGIDRLVAKLNGLESGASGVDKLSAAFKGLKFDPGITDEITKLQIRLGTLASDKITSLKEELSKLNPGQVRETAEALQKIQTLAGAINAGGISNLTGALKSAGAAGFESSNAFNKLVQSLQQTASSGLGVNQSLLSAVSALGQMGQSAGGAAGGLAQAAQGLASLGTAGQIVVGLGVAVALYEIAKGVVTIAGPAVTAAEAVNKFTSSLNAVSKGDLGTRLFKDLSDAAIKTGVSFTDIEKSAKSFAIAANSAGVSTTQLSRTFANLNIGFRGAGLGADETKRAFTALEQIMSKGKIQAQELVIQLGNAVPGALSIAAKAAGTTTAGLQQMAQAGLLLPTDFVVKFGAELQKAFAPAIAEQMRTVSAQMGVMNAVFERFLQAIGGGQFIGLMKGFADALRGVNDILIIVSPAFNALGAVIGDLVGGAFSFLGGILSGVAQGFNLVIGVIQIVAGWFKTAATAVGEYLSQLSLGIPLTDAIKSGLQAIGDVVKSAIEWYNGAKTAFVEWMNSTAAGAAVLSTLNSILSGISSLISTAAQNFQGLGQTIGIFVGVLATVGIGYYAATAASAAFMAATGATSVAMGIATVAAGVLRIAMMALPFVAVAAVATVLIQAFAGWVAESNKVRDSAEGTAGAMKLFAEAAKGGEEGIRKLADEFGTAAGFIKRYAEEANQLERGLKQHKIATKELSDAQEDLSRSTRAAELAQKSSRDALSAASNAAKVRAEDEKKLNREYVESARRAGDKAEAHRREATAMTISQDRAKQLARAVQGAADSDRLHSDALKRKELALKETVEAAHRSEEATQRQIDQQKTYGIIIDDSNAKFLALGLAMGKTDKDAGLFAATLLQVTQTTEQAQAATQKEIAAINVKRGAIQETIKIIEAQNAAIIKARGLSEEAAKNDPTIKANQAIIDSFKGVDQQLQASIIAREVLAGKTAEEADYTASAARVMAKYGDELSKVTTVEKLAEQAMKERVTQTQALVPATDSATQAAERNMTAQEKQAAASKRAADEAKRIADNATQLATSLNSTTGTIDTVSAKFTTMGTAMSTVAASSSKVGTDLANIAKAMEALVPLVPTLDTFAISMTKVGNTSPQIMSLSGALDNMLEALKKLVAEVEAIVPGMGKLAGAATGVGAGYDTATKGVGTFRDALSSLTGPIDAMIDKMNQLKKAAEAALAAAQAAAAASTSRGPSTTAQGGRDGGISGSLPGRHNVPVSAFDNAPHLAEGTANTSNMSRSVSGGGIPAILHANEAVVPLPKGRSIPVEMSTKTDPAALSQLTNALTSSLSTVISDSMMRVQDNNTITVKAALADSAPVAAPLRQSAPVSYATETAQTAKPAEDASNPGRGSGRNNGGQAPINIVMNIQTPDADSFKKSKDQIQAELFRGMRTSFNRNG